MAACLPSLCMQATVTLQLWLSAQLLSVLNTWLKSCLNTHFLIQDSLIMPRKP